MSRETNSSSSVEANSKENHKKDWIKYGGKKQEKLE